MREFLIQCLNAINCSLPQQSVDKLIKFMNLVTEQNKLQNLTSIKDEKDFIIKHITDSLTLSAYVADENIKIIDIGSGAGFPAIPLKIVKNNINLTVVEATKKKADFIQKAIDELMIQNNTTVLCARAEELSCMVEYREKYDIACARAVAPLPVLTELCVPFVKPGGIFIAMKGKDYEEAQSAIEKTGAETKKILTLTLPYSDYKRNIVIIKKVSSTPDKYPRRYSQIIKSPL